MFLQLIQFPIILAAMTWPETWRPSAPARRASGGSVKKIKGVSFLFFTILCCSGVVPTKIKWDPRGPSLLVSSHYYYFDGDTHGNWPIYDPCGSVRSLDTREFIRSLN